MEPFSGIIIDWYNSNKRDLPWRRTIDPYKIWLSEIIMQQTRVEQGTPYYLSFIKNFPTVQKLASAKEEAVLKLWQGLGYYSRARNLHFTAKQIVSDYKGKFPEDFEKILQLKGVGDYTAAAIASFAFNKCHAVVDGNVFRVLSRVFGVSTPIDTGKGRKEFYGLANSLISKKLPGIYNQGLMEFGAIQCKPKNPDCQNCPLQKMCFAYLKKEVENFPVKEKTLKQRDRFFDYLLLKHKGTIIINKRKGKDIWEGLYDFPLIESIVQEDPVAFLSSDRLKEQFGKSEPIVQSISKTYRHILSHQKIFARFWEIELSEPLNIKTLKGGKSISENQIENFAVPRLIENYLEERKMNL